MEFVPGGDFYEWQIQLEGISLTSGRFYISQMVMMLGLLHSQRIIYRDMKPENLMLGADGYLKMVDFGTSTVLHLSLNKTYTICGSPEFLSPEILLKTGHNKATDYWSLGVLIFEIFAEIGPFFDKNPMKLYLKTIKVEYTFPEYFPESAKCLVRGLLIKDPNKRLGMFINGIDDIKKSPFFKSFDWKALQDRKISAPVIPKLKNDKDTRNFKGTTSIEDPLVEIVTKNDPFSLW